ncbi:MAG TPA: hypothetical protein VL096_10785, partial [Pirellulaceae bacterium]|nr:hypothetical protein [Pirellulaceae bacterium]
MSMKYPIAIWEDCQGVYTACVLDGPTVVATDLSAADALLQIKRYMTWLAREQGSLTVADFDELELRDHRVRLRPEYRVNDCAYPVSKSFELRITCVHGTRHDGSRHCVAPTLGLQLSYRPDDPIEELIAEAVQQALGRLTPQQLSRELMPGEMQLSAVHVRNVGERARHEDELYPALQSVAQRLGDRSRARRQQRALLREAEVGLLVDRLLNEEASLLLLGEAGVGKSTVLLDAIRQLPRKVAKQPSATDASNKQKRRFWLTSGARLIAGMKYLGQWEERCEQMIGELAESGSVLCFENLLELLRVGGRESNASVAAFLLPYIERGELRVIAEATTAELDACRQLLPGFADLFQIVRVPELSAADGRCLLDTMLQQGARNARLELEDGLAGLIYRLFKRFQPYAAIPGRSAAFVRHLLDDAARTQRTRLTQHDVLVRFGRESGLPEVLLRDDLALPHAEVLDTFRQAVLHQEPACQAAANVVTALKS